METASAVGAKTKQGYATAKDKAGTTADATGRALDIGVQKVEKGAEKMENFAGGPSTMPPLRSNKQRQQMRCAYRERIIAARHPWSRHSTHHGMPARPLAPRLLPPARRRSKTRPARLPKKAC